MEATRPPGRARVQEAFYSALRSHGVRTVFHLPGSAVVFLYSGLDQFQTVLMRHPVSVGLAADAAGRIAGLGVGIVAQGPGIAGVIPALIHSWKDHVPVVIVTALPGYMKGDSGAWQAFPLRPVLEPVVKGLVEVWPDGSPEAAFNAAFDLAMAPPCGPVVVNVLVGQDGGVMPPLPEASPLPPVPQDFMMKITAALRGSSKPLLLAGGGCIRDAQAVRDLVQGFGLPAVTTAPGRGVVDEAHPLCLGPAGTIGREEANRALCNCDLLLALGSRLSHNVLQPLLGSESQPRIFQVAGPGDRSPLVEPECFAACTVSSVLQGLTMAGGLFSGQGWTRKSEPSSQASTSVSASGGARISPVLAEALAAADGESVLVMDAGTVGLAVYRAFQARKPNHLLYQWGIATMGSSLAAAIGACCSGQKRAVVVAGDAGLLMGMAELSAVAELSLPVKIFVFNNGGMQFIRGIQAKEIGREVDASFGPVDFVSLAKACGIRAQRVKEDGGLTSEIRGALKDARPLLLDVEYGRDEADLKGTQWDRKP